MSPRPLAGRRVTVMGVGLFGGGAATCRFLARRGARLVVTDLRSEQELAPTLAELRELDLELVLGRHEPRHFTDMDLVVANPAVPPRSEFLELARARSVPVTSELALFLENACAELFAITGTQGKSTTCHVLHELLGGDRAGVHLGGNIGNSLLDVVDELAPADRCVLEVSSYQLEALALEGVTRVPTLAAVAITNILSDHLERHGTQEEYARAKRHLLELARAGGLAVVPDGSGLETHGLRRLAFSTGGPSDLDCEEGAFRLGGRALAPLDALTLPGSFQHANALVALGLAAEAGVPPSDLAARLARVRGLPHRAEELGTFAGLRVVDNGVSTTPDSTISVLRSLDGPVRLLIGGQAKRLDYDELAREARARDVHAIAFGRAAGFLAERFAAERATCAAVATLEDAVALAFRRPRPGETLCFSPACASFDAYSNFRARALAFRRAVASLGDERAVECDG